MIEVYCKVVPGGLMCLGEAQAALIEHLHGQEVKAAITKPRNPEFHRKYFAMLEAAREMADVEYNREQWRANVTAGAGWCEFITGSDGQLIAVPKSIKWANMDDAEFQVLYQDSINWICARYLPDTSPDELDRQAEFMAFL